MPNVLKVERFSDGQLLKRTSRKANLLRLQWLIISLDFYKSDVQQLSDHWQLITTYYSSSATMWAEIKWILLKIASIKSILVAATEMCGLQYRKMWQVLRKVLRTLPGEMLMFPSWRQTTALIMKINKHYITLPNARYWSKALCTTNHRLWSKVIIILVWIFFHVNVTD